jgi:hypothetical protein
MRVDQIISRIEVELGVVIEVRHLGKHLEASWRRADGFRVKMVMAATPSDRRAWRNILSLAKRLHVEGVKGVEDGPLFSAKASRPCKKGASLFSQVRRCCGHSLEDKVSTQPIAHSINSVPALVGIGRTGVYEALRTGALKAHKNGRRTVILQKDIEAWLESLPAREVKVGVA